MKRLSAIACVMLVLVLLMLAGCGAKDEWETAQNAAGMLSGLTEDPKLRADTERMLDAIIADDFPTALDTIYEDVSAIEFRRAYVEIQSALAGIEHYELTPANINKTVKNGVSSTSVRYMMTAGEQRFFVEVARAEGYDGLIAFYLNEYQPVIITGTMGNMQGANAAQWIFLVIGLLELVFTICVFVDCCRHKMKKKWLWLLIIALGYVIFSVIATPEQFRISVNVGAFFSYTSLIRYSTGGFVFRVMVPVGAIIYLVMRKSLFAKYAQLQQQKAAAEQPVQPEPIPAAEEITEPEE